MDMVIHEDPCEYGTFSILDIFSESLKEPGLVICIAEYI